MEENKLDNFKEQAYKTVKKATIIELAIFLEACQLEINERILTRSMMPGYTPIKSKGEKDKFINYLEYEKRNKERFFKHIDNIIKDLK